MTEKTRDAFLIALISLLIVTATLLLANFGPDAVGRLVAIVMGMLVIGIIHAVAWYKLRRAEIDADTHIALADMGAMAPRTRDRILPFNASNGRVATPPSDIIQLTETLALPKQDVLDFVGESTKAGGIGLAISRWKLDRGWEQERIEQLLDYMASIGLVTQRENGRACTYVADYTPEQVLRIIGNNAMPI